MKANSMIPSVSQRKERYFKRSAIAFHLSGIGASGERQGPTRVLVVSRLLEKIGVGVTGLACPYGAPPD